MKNSEQEVQLARQDSHPSDAAMFQRQKEIKCNYIVTMGIPPTVERLLLEILYTFHTS